ncbi:MAG: hypothetical protein ACR2NP_19635 [Pirellulaceae bacterium]
MDDRNSAPAVARVIKVGGSLFANPDFPDRFRQWLDQFSDAGNSTLLVAGGGRLVDCVRQLQAPLGLTDEFCHVASLQLMSTTSRLLQHLLPEVPIIDSLDQSRQHDLAILDCVHLAATQSQLPRTWDTTSDSLAAEMAVFTGCDELWLLKSVLPDSPRMVDWIAQGVVDANFPGASKGLQSVYLVNFGDANLLSIRGI